MVVLIEKTQKYQEKAILDFVDQYLKCEKNEDEDLTELHMHKHSQTCKKGGNDVA